MLLPISHEAYSDLSYPMNLYRLRIFLAVARRLSYSRAAEDLFISQPAVSRHVDALEKELGTQLLGQTGNRVYLTESGRLVYSYAQKLFGVEEELDRALAELKHLKRGYLRLGASSTPGIYLLPPVIACFQERYPGVEVSLAVANSREIEERVLRNELDLGFVGAHSRPGLQVRPYARDRLILIVSPRHPLATQSSATVEQLQSEPFLLREQGSGTRRAFEEELARQGIGLARAMELNGSEAVKRGVMAGMGLATVSGYSVEVEMRQGLLRTLRVAGLRLERELSILSLKDVRPSAAALAFVALAQKSVTTVPTSPFPSPPPPSS